MNNNILTLEKTLDLNKIKNLLDENDLPFEDLESSNVQMFSTFKQSEQIGIIGFEGYKDIALLRSMVVLEKYRNKYYGKEICIALLKLLKEQGFIEVYLLTTTAKEFFKKLGFISISRNEVPTVIRNTTEFSSLCPDTAQCMFIKL